MKYTIANDTIGEYIEMPITWSSAKVDKFVAEYLYDMDSRITRIERDSDNTIIRVARR